MAVAVAPLGMLTVATVGAAAAESAPAEVSATNVGAEKPQEKNGKAIAGLTIHYEGEVEYALSRNPDLNKSVKDDLALLTTEIAAVVDYEPNSWFMARLKLTLNRELELDADEPRKELRRTSLNVDEANVKFGDVFDAFAIQLGRRKFEDDRRWLYEVSMDAALVSFERDEFLAEFSVSRRRLVDADILLVDPRDRINNYILFLEYGGIRGVTLDGYTVFRDDRDNREGSPFLMGLRSMGTIVEGLDHWAEIAHVRGRDRSRKLRGYAFDVAGTYRLNLPLNPSLSLGYAFASGDTDANDDCNEAFRQTGLQTNKHKLAGIPQFKIYGEAFDPELSNLRILTVGIGSRPTRTFSIDLVYHHYGQDAVADELRHTAVELKPNQDPSRRSRDLGNEFDVVIGFRDMLGIENLGLDLRAGYFLPGRAFRRLIGQDGNGNDVFDSAESSVSLLATIGYEF